MPRSSRCGTPTARRPYVVRWSDTGHEALVYPGADAFVEHFTGAAAQDD
jgi:hypothetical protein